MYIAIVVAYDYTTRTGGLMPLSRALVQREKNTTSFSIWTRVANSIFYDDNHYAKRNSQGPVCVCVCVWLQSLSSFTRTKTKICFVVLFWIGTQEKFRLSTQHIQTVRWRQRNFHLYFLLGGVRFRRWSFCPLYVFGCNSPSPLVLFSHPSFLNSVRFSISIRFPFYFYFLFSLFALSYLVSFRYWY